jgi:hypothetical protein
MGRAGKDLERMLAALDDTALIKGATIKRIISAVVRSVPIAGANMTQREGPDGVELSAQPGGQSTAAPFTPVLVGADELYFYFTISPGQVHHFAMTCPPIPTYLGDSLASDPAPVIQVPKVSGGHILVLRVTVDVTTVVDWVTSAVVTSLQLGVFSEGAAPLFGVTGMEFYVWIASFNESGQAFPLVGSSISLAFDDDGTATGKAAMYAFFGTNPVD